MPLTPKQLKTLDELANRNWDKIKMNEISSVVNGVFNKEEPADVKKKAIKGSVEWFINNSKSKIKDKASINKIIISKIKRLASSDSDKTTKQMRAEEKELFNEVKDSIKSVDDKDEEEKYDDDEGPDEKAKAPAPPVVVAPAPAPAPAPAQPDYEMMEMMADMRAEQNAREINAEGDSYLDTLGKYIDTGSQFYKDNKKTINKALGALTPKKIQDGSYLTELAGLAVPEIEVFQKVIKAVGLGFSKEDSAKFEKMLSRDKDDWKDISYDESIEILMKMMINPDQVGVLVKTRAGQVADDAKAWWKKIKGEDRDLSPKEEDVKEKIDRRRKEIEDKKNREKGIDDWFGIKETEEAKTLEPREEYSPFKPIHKGGGKISGGGAVINNLPEGVDPVDITDPPAPDYDDMSAYDILIPPGDEFGQTTGWEDVMNVIRNIVSIGGIKIPTKDQNKAQYLEQLKRENPEAFEQYQNALNRYNKTIGKARLERDGFVDYEMSKDYVDNAKNLTQDLIKKAIERGDIEREEAGKLYDVWDLFNGVSSGDEKMTYSQMEQLQQQLYRALPSDLIKENSDAINQFMTDNIDFLQPGWEGDSDLGNFDWLNNILTGEDIDPDDIDIKEKKIDPKKMKPQAEPKYRYRGKWGDTDTLFKREDEEIEKRNLILEIGHLREQLDTTNKLIQAQMTTEKRRFDRTFEMPYCPPVKSRALPEAFKREHRAIFTPQYVNPLREPDRNMFMNPTNDYGQYKEWSDRVPESSARSYLIKDPLVYPSNADIATGGELPPIAPAKDYNYILNQRFIR
jgi:hypothetical protein